MAVTLDSVEEMNGGIGAHRTMEVDSSGVGAGICGVLGAVEDIACADLMPPLAGPRLETTRHS